MHLVADRTHIASDIYEKCNQSRPSNRGNLWISWRAASWLGKSNSKSGLWRRLPGMVEKVATAKVLPLAGIAVTQEMPAKAEPAVEHLRPFGYLASCQAPWSGGKISSLLYSLTWTLITSRISVLKVAHLGGISMHQLEVRTRTGCISGTWTCSTYGSSRMQMFPGPWMEGRATTPASISFTFVLILRVLFCPDPNGKTIASRRSSFPNSFSLIIFVVLYFTSFYSWKAFTLFLVYHIHQWLLIANFF